MTKRSKPNNRPGNAIMKRNLNTHVAIVALCFVTFAYSLESKAEVSIYPTSRGNIYFKWLNNQPISLYAKAEIDNKVTALATQINAVSVNSTKLHEQTAQDLKNTKEHIKTFVISENRKVIQAVKQAPLSLLKEDVMEELEERLFERLVEHLKEQKETEELFDDYDN